MSKTFGVFVISLVALGYLLVGCAAGQESATGGTAETVAEWPTATPAAVGLDAAVLDSIDAEIRAGRHGLVDHLLVIRQGQKVFDVAYNQDYEAAYGDSAKVTSTYLSHHRTGAYNYFNDWWHPYYRETDLHSLQSVTKTITSVVIGVAVTRGDFPSIDTPVLTFFDTTQVANLDARKRNLTIRHLLTMATGMDFDEGDDVFDLENSYDWVDFAINTPMREAPGTRFNYDSGGSQLLSHIFYEATGQDIEEYAVQHLFTPLGITDWYWKRTPAGRIDTLGGLYLAAEDLARIWYLFVQDGQWNGTQIISSDWVEASVTPAVAVNPERSNVQYGYKWWLWPHPTDSERYLWAGSGFGGQYPVAAADEDLVVVIYQWNILSGGSQPRMNPRATMERLLRSLSGP